MSKEQKDDQPQGVSGWLEFNGLQTHCDVEAVSPAEPYLKGYIQSDRHFQPLPPIQGDVMDVPAEATRGWLTFAPVEFHSMVESTTKVPPYIDGAKLEENFYPTGPLELGDDS